MYPKVNVRSKIKTHVFKTNVMEILVLVILVILKLAYAAMQYNFCKATTLTIYGDC